MKRMNMPDSWEVEIACLLSQIGCIGIPGEVLEKRLNGLELTNAEEDMFFKQAEVGKTLLKNIPRLEKIAEGISMQYLPYSDLSLKGSLQSDEHLLFIPKILRDLNDYFFLVEKGINEQEAIKYILEERDQYDPTILEVLEAEVAGAQDGYIVKSIKLAELKNGMILAADLIDNTNYKILSKGTSLSEVYILKLQNYSKIKGIKEPVKVLLKANDALLS